MSRKAVRGAVLCILMAAVAGLAVRTTLINAELRRGLLAGGAIAYASLAERSDNYAFLQAETPASRIIVARGLAKWQDPRSVLLAQKLARDPDAKVRDAIINSLASACNSFPTAAAAALQEPGTSEREALIEALCASPQAGLEIAKAGLENPASRDSSAAVLLRLGKAGAEVLAEGIKSKDTGLMWTCAEAVASLGYSIKVSEEWKLRLWTSYSALPEGPEKDRAFVLVCEFPASRAGPAMRSALSDSIAPWTIRCAAARGLAKIRDWQPLRQHLADFDEAVAQQCAKSLAAAFAELKKQS